MSPPVDHRSTWPYFGPRGTCSLLVLVGLISGEPGSGLMFVSGLQQNTKKQTMKTTQLRGAGSSTNHDEAAAAAPAGDMDPAELPKKPEDESSTTAATTPATTSACCGGDTAAPAGGAATPSTAVAAGGLEDENDGKNEDKAMAASVAVAADGEAAAEMVDTAGKNNTMGNSTAISYEEMEAACLYAADTDGDGQVSAEECQTFCEGGLDERTGVLAVESSFVQSGEGAAGPTAAQRRRIIFGQRIMSPLYEYCVAACGGAGLPSPEESMRMGVRAGEWVDQQLQRQGQGAQQHVNPDEVIQPM
ncbi:unnamed protein product [Amoebophrya sp. A120]|nr:unnamed protein product [Amoebophrya sp. A120]|eukprot:GSA120T00000285001.1